MKYALWIVGLQISVQILQRGIQTHPFIPPTGSLPFVLNVFTLIGVHFLFPVVAAYVVINCLRTVRTRALRFAICLLGADAAVSQAQYFLHTAANSTFRLIHLVLAALTFSILLSGYVKAKIGGPLDDAHL